MKLYDRINIFRYARCLKDIDEYNADKERKILLFFDGMIIDMINNKNLNWIVAELFKRGRKSSIFLVFIITQSYFKIPKTLD